MQNNRHWFVSTCMQFFRCLLHVVALNRNRSGFWWWNWPYYLHIKFFAEVAIITTDDVIWPILVVSSTLGTSNTTWWKTKKKKIPLIAMLQRLCSCFVCFWHSFSVKIFFTENSIENEERIYFGFGFVFASCSSIESCNLFRWYSMSKKRIRNSVVS